MRHASGPQYIAFLEQKLKRLEGVVQDISSCTSTGQQGAAPERRMDISFSDPMWSTLPNIGRIYSTISIPPSHRGSIDATNSQSSDNDSEDALETVRSRDQDTVARGRNVMTIYRGQTTGVEVFRILRGLCNTYIGLKIDSDDAAMEMANALDSAFPTYSDSSTSLAKMCFSSEASIKRWIDIAFSQAFNLWPFIDRDDLNFHAQRLIEEGHSGRGRSDDDHLGLVHAVIALGQRHDVELINATNDNNAASNPPGIEQFGMARNLVPLTQCSRSITAVQTIFCMAIYSKSVAAQRMVHTYVSMAGYAAHQLGLHGAANDRYASEKDKTIRRRVYDVLRTFDGYVTCSLGLPRSLRGLGHVGTSIDAPYLGQPEMLLAANVNLDLLDIMGDTRENLYMINTSMRAETSSVVSTQQLQEFDNALDRWVQKYPAFAQITDNELSSCSKPQLFLG